MSVILIGGTPGTGKTKVAKALGARLSVDVISLGDLADSEGCISAEDKARDTGIINEDCLVDAIIDIVDDEKGKRLLIEGHYIDLVPNGSVQWVFLLRTHPEQLRSRLQERNYSDAKIAENVEAEVLGVCQLDLRPELINLTLREVAFIDDQHVLTIGVHVSQFAFLTDMELDIVAIVPV